MTRPGRVGDAGARPGISLRTPLVRNPSYGRGMATHWTLGGRALDPHRQAAFWALALGYVPEPGYDWPGGASLVDPEGVGPAIGWLKVDDGLHASNHQHIDIRVAGEPPWDMEERGRMIRELVPVLVDAGATLVFEVAEEDGTVDHVIMLDPEGNEFCVA